MSEATNNGICPHCDMGMVDIGGPGYGGPLLVKCQYCRGDWRNYVKKPEPQPDVHPTNHMDSVGRRLCSSWPSEEELRKLYQQPMADNPIPPFMDEHLVSQFGKLSTAESEAYSKMLNFKFSKPDVILAPSFVYEGPHYTPEQKAYLEELEAKFEDRLREERKKQEAIEYNQLMDLTLTYQWEDVRSIQCPACCTGGFGCTPYSKCNVCRGGGYVKVVVIRPPQP